MLSQLFSKGSNTKVSVTSVRRFLHFVPYSFISESRCLQPSSGSMAPNRSSWPWRRPSNSHPTDTTGYGGKAMVSLLCDWIRAIREGDDCRNTPESTVTVLKTIDSIYESSENGRRVMS